MNTNPVVRIKRSLVQGKVPTTDQLGLGELAINHFDGKLFIRQDTQGVGIGTTVIFLGQQGPQGSQGLTGPQGFQGPQGTVGAQGTAGAQGAQGTAGAQGAQGPQGAQGSAGAQGAQGSVGAQGAQGTAGAQGAQGTAGAQGAQGSVGAQGAQGTAGAQGAQGTAGAQGAQGTAGAQGAQGTAGAQGAQGSAGAQGAQGTAGAQGAQGTAGAQGAQGTAGAQGAQGTAGAQGSVGAQGAQGVTGPVAGSANQVVYKDGSNNPAGSNNLTFDGSNLYVGGNITIGGTTAFLAVNELKVKDKDIVLGITTNISGVDISTDTTANHGGIAIASTEGTPLIDINVAGIDSIPSTYKQIMWIKGGTLGAGTTDAWLFNYGVGIGSTQVPNGVRLAAGRMQVTDTNLLLGSTLATGTASQPLQVTGGAYFSGVADVTGSIGVGIKTPQGALDIRTSPQWSSFNYGANLIIGGGRNNGIGILDSTNSNPWAIGNNAGSLVFAQMPGLGNTTSPPSEAARITTNRNLLIGSITETGTASQPLQVTGGAYVSGNLGVGATNPLAKLDVRGDVYIGGVDAGPNFIAFRGTTGDQPGNYNHTYIGERLWGGTESSELFIFKGNDIVGASGPDRIRLAAAEIRLDTYTTPVSGTFDGVATSANIVNRVALLENGNLGIGNTAPTQNLHVQGNVRITGGLYDSNNQVGAASSVLSSTGSGLRWVSPQSGPQGAQGTAGAQGSAGAQGAQGTAGAQGSAGAQGAAGAQGSVGAQGAQGIRGPQGPQGAQGTAGAQGSAGAQGAQGTAGAQGSAGAQGAQGTTGAQGSAGAQGAAGAQGTAGAQGSAGAQGAQGTAGAQGSAGAQGAQGTTGAQGSAGAQGAAGAQGSVGAQGAGGLTTTTATRTENTVTGTNSADLVYGNMADNDQFRIRIGGTATNTGFAEISTADDGTEPIYVRQYTGVFTTLARTATLLDGSGNTSFPNTVTATTFSGALSGNASTASAAAGSSFFTQATATEGNIGAQFTGQNSVYLYNNGSNWGIYSASGGSAFQYTRSSGLFNFNGNANTATTLATTRTIWGQNFNGSANVSGALSGASTIDASSDISLGGELNFTTASAKYIDFYTDNDAGALSTAHLRLVNNASNSFHLAVTMARGGAVTLYHNNAAKLATSSTGVDITGTLTVSSSTLVTNLNADLWDGYQLSTRGNWSTNSAGDIVVGQLSWKNYGNNHTIFDASQATSPNGGAVNNTNPDVTWTATYPTLMGWNGANTYGVRVDSARYADNLTGQPGSYYLNASNLASGTVPTARLGSGTANATTYLRGDQTWATVTSGITISDDTSTNATRYVTFEDITSGSSSAINVSSTKLTFNPSTGTLSATVFTSLSDLTQKKNIQKISNSTDLIKQINGVRFDWKDSDESSAGVIAQDVEKVLPEIIHTNDEGVKSVNYNGIIGLLIEAIKEQQVRIEELERKLNA